MTAIYHVIRNRTLASRNGWPKDMEQVCLQPWQFSCWNATDPQRSLYPSPTDPSYELTLPIISTLSEDPTGGATAYFDISITPPSWATPARFTVQIGRLRFFKV